MKQIGVEAVKVNLFKDADEHLSTEVALGRFGVGVDDESVWDLEPGGHLDVDPGRPTRHHGYRPFPLGGPRADTAVPLLPGGGHSQC